MPEASERRCSCGCGASLEGRGAGALFANRACKTKYHNLDMRRGAEILASLQVWRASRFAKEQRGKDLGNYAFREACAMIDEFNRVDRAAGRSAAPLIEARFDRGELFGDRQFRRERKARSAAMLKADAQEMAERAARRAEARRLDPRRGRSKSASHPG